ncbi:MAG: hypothetical protein QNI91_14935 [Arenicellales bacterium]|nr:hypothetical protein [Arenicellales bacterium]
MTLSETAEAAVRNIETALSISLEDEKKQKVTKAIEKALIDAVLEISSTSTKVISQCCSADKDMAHKINDEIERNKKALIANLSSFR